MQCITGARHNMTARLLRRTETSGTDYTTGGLPNGAWEDSQDPLTGEVTRSWEPTVIVVDNQTTLIDETAYEEFPCAARGFSTSSRFSSTQVFGDQYKNIDLVRMWIPSDVLITKDDRISHIKSAEGIELWPGIVFNVSGVTPQIGPFGAQTETFLMLERSEV